jgi:hypothetical protein
MENNTLLNSEGCSEWIESPRGLSDLLDHCDHCGEELSEDGCTDTECALWEDCPECGALKEICLNCENCDESHG